MNVVDSSAWLEYLTDGPNAAEFASVIEETDRIVVPAIIVYEVFKRVAQMSDDSTAYDAAASMMQCRIAAIDAPLALAAARVSLETGLAMADSIIYATATESQATLWTQDSHFQGMARVEYRERRTSA